MRARIFASLAFTVVSAAACGKEGPLLSSGPVAHPAQRHTDETAGTTSTTTTTTTSTGTTDDRGSGTFGSGH